MPGASPRVVQVGTKVQLVCENRAYPASTAAPWQVKTGAKVLQIFTRFDLP
jgi:hypothetical protein